MGAAAGSSSPPGPKPGTPSPPASTVVRVLLGVFLLALAVRIAYLLAFRGSPFFGGLLVDSQWHDEWAWGWAQGTWSPEGHAFFRAPLYPLWLSFLYRVFGHDLLAARVVQMVLGAATCAFTAGAAARQAGGRVGWVTGIVAALYGTSLFFDGELLIPNLLLFLLSGALFMLAGRPTWGHGIGAGFVTGLAAVARPNVLVLVPVQAAWIAWRARRESAIGRGRAWALAVVTAGVACLPALGVTAINLGLERTWVLVASQGGVNFAAGNHSGASGRTMDLAELGTIVSWREFVDRSREVAEEAVGRPLTSAEVDRWWFHRGLEWIGAHPGEALGLYARKAYYLLNANEVANNRDPYVDRRGPLRLLLWKTGFFAFPWGLVFPLAVVGWVATRRRREWKAWGIFLAAWFLLYGLSLLPFFVTARFRMGLLLPLFALAGIALAHPRAWWGWKGWTAGILALVLANSTLAGVRQENRGLELARLGEILLREGRVEDAIDLLEQAHALDPRGLATVYVLAEAYAQGGRPGDAERLYLRVRETRPDDPDLAFNLGVVELQLGRYEAAAAAFESALAMREDGAFWVNLGVAREGQGDGEGAEEAYRAGIRIAPGDEIGYLRLAGLLIDGGDLPDGLAVLEEGVTRVQTSFDLRYALAMAYVRAGKYEAALEQADTLLHLRHDDPRALRLQRRLEAMLGGSREGGEGGEGGGP